MFLSFSSDVSGGDGISLGLALLYIVIALLLIIAAVVTAICWKQREFEKGWTNPTTHPISNNKESQDVRGMSGGSSLSDSDNETMRKFDAWVRETEMGVANEGGFDVVYSQ